MKVTAKTKYFDKELDRAVNPDETIEITEARYKELLKAGVVHAVKKQPAPKNK